MHAKVRRESVAGYATDETLVCGPKEHTRWWQRYRGHLQGILYRLILNSYITATYSTHAYIIMCDGHAIALSAGNGMAWPTPLAPNGDANRTAPRHDRNSAQWLHRRLQTEKRNSCRQAGKGIHRHTERAQTRHPADQTATPASRTLRNHGHGPCCLGQQKPPSRA